ncbi:DedA family protein [Candidatus Woesearchaeota archaeon]|nr:DedA family protein [Candidatus Woesearchaeota archaeon]
MNVVFDRLVRWHKSASAWLRRMYAWVLSWAYTKYAALVLFIVAFLESSIFPLPPDTLIVLLALARPSRAFWYAVVGTVGSVLGGLLGYYVGAVLFDSVGQLILDSWSLHDEFAIVGEYFSAGAFLTIAGAAFTPIPYKVFTIAAGFWSIDLWVFFIASLAGRGLRFFLEASLLFFFGKRIEKFVEKYLGWLSFGLFLIVVLIVIAWRYW